MSVNKTNKQCTEVMRGSKLCYPLRLHVFFLIKYLVQLSGKAWKITPPVMRVYFQKIVLFIKLRHVLS